MDTAPPGTATPPSDHPTLVLIRGLPGSGKSYVAKALQKAFGEDRVLILDPDAIDQQSKDYQDLSASLTAEGVDQIFHPNRYLKSKGYEGIDAHKIIIWNQAFTNLGGFHRSIVSLQTYATKHDIRLPVLLVEVEISHDVAKKRAAKRHAETGRGVSDEAFERFINDYETFSKEGYDTVQVNGEDDAATSVATVMQALQQLWAPAK